MSHDPMDWTVGTFGTVENDALDAGDRLRTSWTLGSADSTKTWILNDGGFRPEPDVVFGPNQTKQVLRSAKFGPKGRTMHNPW